MAEGNKIARRSTRPFADEYPKPASDTGAEPTPGTVHKRPSDREETRSAEKAVHSRGSSCSTITPADAGMEPRGVHGVARETAREVTKYLEIAKNARHRVKGRPVNFGMVIPGVYRSGYPEYEDYDYLKKLGLKTIVTLVQKDFPEGYQTFIQLNGIKHIVIDMQGTKKVEIKAETMKAIMSVVLDPKNHPLLVHCNHGKHRTGCTVAILRKMMGWSIESIIDEYCSYADNKIRENDIQYITSFDIATLARPHSTPKFDSGVRTSGWRESPNASKLAKVGRLATFTMLVLLLWVLTAFHIRV